MDQRITAQGIIRVQNRNEKKPVQHQKSTMKNENFEIDRNEFPSLNEISDKIGNHGKNSSDFSKFSYSEKLKKAPAESRSSLKLDAGSDVSKSSVPFVREYSSVRNKTPIKNSMARSLKLSSENSDSDGLNEVPLSSRRVSNPEHSRMNKDKTSHKCHGINNSEWNGPLTNPKINTRTANEQVSKPRSEISSRENYKKVNFEMNRKSKYLMSDRTRVVDPQSILENIKTKEDLQNAGPSTPPKKLLGDAPNFQNRIFKNERNSSVFQGSNKGVNSDQIDLQPTEVKKKKRKSKVKRQAALQTGKIFVLTPEAHSRILNQSNITSSKQNKNVVVNINDSEEYPELGTSAVHKNNKENTVKPVEMTTKDSSVMFDKNELDIVKLESDVTSEPISLDKETLEIVQKDGKMNAKPSDSEKAPGLIKDPITVSLFDMLLSAQTRKKEAEKKNELVVQDSLKSAKSSSKVIGKKGVSYAVNPLVSSTPAVKRGKEREKPKVKKPSRMRKLILLGRQLRKEEMETLDENEKTDTLSTVHLDDRSSPSKWIDIKDDTFNHNFTCHTKNISLSDNEDIDSELSSLENSGNPVSGECQDVANEQNKFTNNQNIFNDCETETLLATESIETKASNRVFTNDWINIKELEGNEESSIKDSLNSSNQYSSQELTLEHFKGLDKDISFETLSSHDCIPDEIKCVLDNILVYAKNENQSFDFEMRKDDNSAFVEKQCSENYQSCMEFYRELNSCNLSTYQSFLENNVDDESGKLEKSPSISLLNTAEKENVTDDAICGVGFPLNIEAIPSSSSMNEKDESNFVTNSEKVSSHSLFHSGKNVFSSAEQYIHSEESPIKEDSLESDLNENTGSGHLSKQIENDITANEEKVEAVKTMIHSRKFRKYCNHFVSKEIDTVVFTLLDDLARFQDRMHQKDPVKARVRKRLLYGIKEIKRHLKLKKLKGIILATDIEDIKTEGGLNDVIAEIISLAEAYHIPYIFSHRRFNLGKVCRKGVAVSCVGIFNYEGAEKNFKRILELQEESKHDYIAVTKALDAVLSHNQIIDVLKLKKGVPEKLYEMRACMLKEHFKLDANQSECELDASEVPTQNADDSKASNALICENSIGTSAPKDISKSEIYNILTKYNIV